MKYTSRDLVKGLVLRVEDTTEFTLSEHTQIRTDSHIIMSQGFPEEIGIEKFEDMLESYSYGPAMIIYKDKKLWYLPMGMNVKAGKSPEKWIHKIEEEGIKTMGNPEGKDFIETGV